MSGEHPNEREQSDRRQANEGNRQRRQQRTPQRGGQQSTGGQQQGAQSGRQGAGQQQQRGARSSRRPSRGGESVTSILSEASGKRFLLYIVGVFAAVAVGYGVGLLLLDAFAGDAGTFLGALALFIPILGAPIIAMTTGLLTGLRLRASDTQAAVVSGVGAVAGFLVMLVILLVFAALVLDNGGSGTGTGGTDGSSGDSLSDSLGPLVGFSTGVAVAGAATTYVVKRIEI